MDNYKILNTKTNAIIKLLNELGYAWVPTTNESEASLLKAHWIIAESSGDIAYSSTETFYVQDSYKELSFNQLNDVVVLKRNDVKDANYRSAKVSDGLYFKSCDGKFYFMFEGTLVLSEIYTDEGLEPITQNQVLISGAEALRALADGKSIEWQDDNGIWWPLGVGWTWNQIVNSLNGIQALRLKPQTIKLELELPKPFEPEEDCHVYILDDGKTDGYRRYSYEVHGDKGNTFIGIWRTEEEIKQVVEQLRKIRGAS